MSSVRDRDDFGATAGGESAKMLARADVRALPLYAPDEGTCTVDVSDNTNLWGAPPAAVQAIREFAAGASRYPSLYGAPLKDALRRYVGVPDAAIVTGCGSDDVIDCSMRAFGAPGDRIAFATPTFSMVPVFARINGLEPVGLPYRDDWDIDAEALVDARAKITYLCAPNNPTATPASRAAIEFVVERAAGVVVLDEAYAEFASVTCADLVARSDRLLVVRTFSKAFGLAGLRVGYGAGAPDLVAMIERVRGPYKLNTMAERAAVAALADAPDALEWVRTHAALARDVRDRLIDALRGLGLAPLPSDANFVFVPLAEAAAVGRRMIDRGVLVRSMRGLDTRHPVLREARGAGLRMGVGPWEQIQRVIDVLSEALT